jgi:hypothetical protein
MADPLRRKELRQFIPPEKVFKRIEWPLERAAFVLLWTLLPLCGSWWFIDRHEELDPKLREKSRRNCREKREAQARGRERKEFDRRRAAWVGFWLVGLFVMWLISPTGGALQPIFGVLASLRLLEIFTTGLGTILQTDQQVRARNVVTILTYAIQVMLIFAILFHSFEAHGFAGHPHRPSEFLYISWSAMVSLGNNTFTPLTPTARFLEVGATTSSIFLFGVLLALGIDVVQKGKVESE